MTELKLSEKAQEAMQNVENWSYETEDEPICAICKIRVKDDVPLWLYNEANNTAISFHIECGLGDKK